MISFLNSQKPIITTLLSATTIDGLLKEIDDAIIQGTDAFGLQIERLPKEFRTAKIFKQLISVMEDKPCYATCYKRWDVIEETDEERCAHIISALESGAVLADVRADLFDAQDGEFSIDNAAVKKQKAFIKQIHDMGKEVLMSSHIIYDNAFKYIQKEKVVEIALEHERRGADIAKIVSNADTEEELLENFEAILLCKKTVKIPVLFLCNGKNSSRHRLASGLICEPMVFTKEKSFYTEAGSQPTIETIVKLFNAAYKL